MKDKPRMKIAIENITKVISVKKVNVEKELLIIVVRINPTINRIIFANDEMMESLNGSINFFLFSSGTERQNNAAEREKKIEMRPIYSFTL